MLLLESQFPTCSTVFNVNCTHYVDHKFLFLMVLCPYLSICSIYVINHIIHRYVIPKLIRLPKVWVEAEFTILEKQLQIKFREKEILILTFNNCYTTYYYCGTQFLPGWHLHKSLQVSEVSGSRHSQLATNVVSGKSCHM